MDCSEIWQSRDDGEGKMTDKECVNIKMILFGMFYIPSWLCFMLPPQYSAASANTKAGQRLSAPFAEDECGYQLKAEF